MVRFGVAIAALACMAAPLFAQESTEQLKKELEQLRAEVEGLKAVNQTREIPAQGKIDAGMTTEPTISRLSELCAPAFQPSVSDRFLVEPRDYSALFTDTTSPLRFMAQKWRMSLGYFDPSVTQSSTTSSP